MRVAWLLIAACGSSSAPPVATTAVVSPAESADDLVVAKVNGRPVWASCVAKNGLQTCISFELLAQAAEQQHVERDPIVAEQIRTELVSRVVALEYEAGVTKFEDFHGAFDRLLAQNEVQRHRPDVRASTYARVNVAKGADDKAAHAAAQQLADALANERGLLHPNVVDAAHAIEAKTGQKFEVAKVELKATGQLVKSYADALFAIPEIGRASTAVRTDWGWDVIVLTDELPPREQTRDEQIAEMWPQLKRQYFPLWVDRVKDSLGITVSLDGKPLEAAE